MSCSAWEIHPVGAFSSVGADIALGKALECHLVLLPAEVPEDWVSYGLKEFFYRCSMWSQHWHYTQDGWSLPWRLGGGLKAFFSPRGRSRRRILRTRWNSLGGGSRLIVGIMCSQCMGRAMLPLPGESAVMPRLRVLWDKMDIRQ